jgi:glycosyltransferase involved in cell wall biosynthesis
MHVSCLAKRWPHHTASGGYDRLARETGATVFRRAEGSAFLARALKRFWLRMAEPKVHLIDYRYEDFLAEWSLLARSWVRKPDVAHVLYGDEQLDLLIRWRRLLPSPLIASFHLPTVRVADRFERSQKHLVAGIDAAVVVSRCQLNDFQSWLGPDKVVYVPHGVDTQTFCPGNIEPQSSHLRLVMVGHHMRDWEASHRIIDECRVRNLPVQFKIVLRERLWPVFTGCTNVHLQAEISEEELIRLYREADALLIPVTDSTANNAVLEALACGTPVITNSVGGMPDYIDDNCGWLFHKGEVFGILELLEQLSNNPEIARSRRKNARLKSLEFSWDRVARQMSAIYNAVADGYPPVAAVAAVEQNVRVAPATPTNMSHRASVVSHFPEL